VDAALDAGISIAIAVYPASTLRADADAALKQNKAFLRGRLLFLRHWFASGSESGLWRPRPQPGLPATRIP
jgi:hypothetical protein